ncbi:MAG TPA: PQQ-dependent sugar dehydrogenase [Solirubrobacterales bacterium]|jgi:glucose/arabinose dehydrogenase|nr:PQQ-dependent sugar dehydrogenase [Solirubrobacterales bacterium]
MRQATRLLVCALAAAAAMSMSAQAAASSPAGPAVELHKLGDFSAPVDIAQPHGPKKPVLVAENAGTIAVWRAGAELDHKFLDIRDLVDCGCGEEGLKSIAFDPGYRHNRRFYVLYTNTDGNTEVDSFERFRGSAVRANPASRQPVIVIPQDPSISDFGAVGDHEGDQLQFGPDGHLYISVGDGGCCYDPSDNARNLDSLHGKILRIDPKPNGGYAIPLDNPLVGKPGLDEIFAWGFRNPWRFSFDGDRIAIGDVGEATQEEVDYETIDAAAGGNFGWPEYEGTVLDDPSRPGPGTPLAPISTYPHSPPCTSLTGGYVVRDRKLRSLYGRYIYADFCSGELRSFVPALGGATDDEPLGLTVPRAGSFGQGVGGTIYVASHLGPVYRLDPVHGVR